MKKTYIIFILFTILASVCSGGGPFSPKKPTRFSMQMHTLSGEFERHKKTIDLIRDAGIGQVRDECFWHMVEKDKGVYKIPEHVIRNLDYALSQGIDTLIILNYTNDHYDDGMAPTSKEAIEAFGEYCFTMARDLKGKVPYFEVWNEPNADGFWQPKADPVAYTALLKEAYRRIKEGNPNALVCGISLAGIVDDYFWEVMEAGGYNYMDTVSVHPYCPPRTPEEAEIFEKMEKMHDRFTEYGSIKKQLWLTEIGWPTNKGGGITEYEQASRIVRTYLNAITRPFIDTTFIYWFGPDGPDEEWAEHRFGMIRMDWSKKPSFIAYREMTDCLSGADFSKVILEDDNVRVYRYKNQSNGMNVDAAWALKGYRNLLFRCRGPVELVDLRGHKKMMEPLNGKIYLRIGEMPVIIRSAESLEWQEIKDKDNRVGFEYNPPLNIPRGQERIIGLYTPLAISGSHVDFLTDTAGGLEFKKAETINNQYAFIVPPHVNKGVKRIQATLTSRGKILPSVYLCDQVNVTEPVELYISPLPPRKDEKNFLISIKNLGQMAIAGSVYIKADDEATLDERSFHFKNLAPNATFTRRVGVLSYHPPDRVFPLTLETRLSNGVVSSYENQISFYECIKIEKAPLVDGDLSDWPPDVNVINMALPEQRIAGYVTPEGPEDISVRVYTAWDEEWFHIGVEFQDDRLSSPCAGFTVYNNDGIEIYFDTNHEGDRWENRYSDDDNQYGFSLEQGDAVVYSWSQIGDYSRASRIGLNTSPEASQTLSGKSFRGMIMEGAIPMSELKIKPRDGLQIGFNLAATDDDNPLTLHPFFQEVQFSWSHRKNAWQNPQAFADLFFIDPKASDSIEIRGREVSINGENFIPFGFWTFGWNEERFHELSSHGINALGVEFAWDKLEPEQGVYDASYIKDCAAWLDLARKYGIYCVVQPAMHYSPDWLENNYPDARFITKEKKPGEGSFMKFCPDDPEYRELLRKAINKMVSSLRGHPQILAYSPWNEPGLSNDICYCEDTAKRFGKEPPKCRTDKNWTEWMQFRQDNFLEFFLWMKGIIASGDPERPIVVKSVWCPLDSTIAWAHGTRYDYWSRIGEIMGNDPYPHPRDFFINRWVADWLRSAGPDKPIWFLEYNRAFAKEQGRTSPEEIRSWSYQALAHGVNGFFYFFYPMDPYNPNEADNHLAFSEPDDLSPLPALNEIYGIAAELKTIRPLLDEYQISEPEIAILHSWPTYFHLAGEMYPTANETVPAQILYELGFRVRFITEEDIQSRGLQGVKILFVTGSVAVSDATINAVEQFHDNGGHVFACARFAEMNEYGSPRENGLPEFFKVKVHDRMEYQREIIDLVPVKYTAKHANDTVEDKVLKPYRYDTKHPMKWESPLFDFFYEQGYTYQGHPFSSGVYTGFEDMKANTELIERITAEPGATVFATFAPLQPAIVATDRSIYIARDLSWSDQTMRRFILSAVTRAGIERFAWAQRDGETFPQIDVGALINDDGNHLVFVNCFNRLNSWDGSPIDSTICFNSGGVFQDVLTGLTYNAEKDENMGAYIFRKVLQPGEVLCLREMASGDYED